METGSAEAFAETGTLGIEEEFFVVDGEGRPTSGTDELVYEATPPPVIEDRVDHELFKCVIETQTPTLEGIDGAAEALRAMREALVEYAGEHGYGIAGAGLHPAAKWRELAHAEKPRYRSQLDRIQYPQHRNTTAGLHVHVGVDDPDKAAWVANKVRWHLPLLLALSANSPYWNGFDTGLQSARAKIFEGLPNTGMPNVFEGMDDYLDYERRMLETESIEDRGEIWFDVRPHTANGSVEIRSPDGQRDPDVVLAVVEYVHALVLDLAARYEDHPDPWSEEWLRRELLDENKWRAIRSGHDASFLEPGGGTVGLGEALDRAAERLGVSGVRAIYDAESGAERQRRIREQEDSAALRSDLLLAP